MKRIRVIDSHTEGEPTRLIIEGGPALAEGPISKQVAELTARYDAFRKAVVLEPRGSEAVVGALLCSPTDNRAAAGVIFFNNVGYLGMCGHGTIGLIASLAYLGRIHPGTHLIETPVGIVSAHLHRDGAVSVDNVRSYRLTCQVTVEVSGYGLVTGDVAWGGNWFFLSNQSHVPILASQIGELTAFAKAIKTALAANVITGSGGAEIDHIELFGPPTIPNADSKNFVLCPGGAYDRSPCGTGISAKLACLAADGKLSSGQVWRQESIIGTSFRGEYQPDGNGIMPTITGRAFVTGDNTLIFDDEDPLKDGI